MKPIIQKTILLLLLIAWFLPGKGQESNNEIKPVLAAPISQEILDKYKEEAIAKDKEIEEKTDSLNKINESISYAGKIVLKKEVPIYCALDPTKEKREYLKAKDVIITCEKEWLALSKVSFTISDNFIRNIIIEGKLKGENEAITPIYNNLYSLPLRLTNDKFSIRFKHNQEYYRIFISDVFTYNPGPNGEYSFIVKDEEFVLLPEKEHLLKRRGLNDYIGLNVMSDFFGILEDRNNSSLQVAANVVAPLRYKKRSTFLWVSSFRAGLNFSILNGINELGNFKELNSTNSSVSDVITDKSIDTLYMNSFDQVRQSNLRAGFQLNLLTWERKKSNLFVSPFGKININRAGFQHTTITDSTDIVDKFQLWSFAPELGLLFQYKPDFNFGAEIVISASRTALLNGNTNNAKILESASVYDQQDYTKYKYHPIEEKDRWYFTYELDLYSHIAKNSKGGLFAKLGAQFNGFAGGSEINPMIFIGYSTNIDAFVGSLKTK